MITKRQWTNEAHLNFQKICQFSKASSQVEKVLWLKAVMLERAKKI